MKKIGIIHTTPVTIDLFKTLAAEILPGVGVMNIMDDTILPQLLVSDGDLAVIEERWLSYARTLYQAGADLIVSGCSSVGELARKGAEIVPVPVLRIDEAMAESAVRGATRIGVAATFPTTLKPTERLLREKAGELGKSIEVRSVLASSAYQRLASGDQAGHDRELLTALMDLSQDVELIVLAQASMARVLNEMNPERRQIYLTSPRSGMERVRQVLEQME